MQINKCQEKVLILMDNCGSHKCNNIKSWAVYSGIEIVFNIPYYPKANPIELFFAELKTRSKIINTKNHQQLAEEIVKVIDKIPQCNYQSYFRKAYKSCKEHL